MALMDIEAIRAEVRALEFERGSPADVADWREADAESRANLAIEGMALDPDEAALFDMLRDEAVPPPLATRIARQNPIWAITALTHSRRLCGGMLVARPMAMPLAPLTSMLGNRAGRTVGSRSLPS